MFKLYKGFFKMTMSAVFVEAVIRTVKDSGLVQQISQQ